MSGTTEIEKKSLEAHVELCAERYNALEDRIDNVDHKISSLSAVVREVHDMIQRMSDQRTDQLVKWGAGIIGTLVATIAWLVAHYVIK
jgi:predicted  nucleic acid-binding Zn-ribbon protein|tara:strand:+ start:238 stop:501 length:264 start_codon:yes stop_codon:yes gene_type:complete